MERSSMAGLLLKHRGCMMWTGRAQSASGIRMALVLGRILYVWLALACMVIEGANSDIDLATLAAPIGFIMPGAKSGDKNGFAVSNAGDVNKDGMDDLLVSSQGASPNIGGNVRPQAGTVYVVFGQSFPVGTSPPASINFADLDIAGSVVGFAIFGAAADDQCGVSLSGTGDVNGDGIDDILIGSLATVVVGSEARNAAGIAYVVFGRSITSGAASYTNIDLYSLTIAGTALGFRIMGANANDWTGFSVSGAGDVNKDGIRDLVVGAYRAGDSRAEAGVAYVVFGRNTTHNSNGHSNIDLHDFTNGGTPAGFRILGAAAGDWAGCVGGAGDVNNDGVDDVIVGAYRGSADVATKYHSGMSYVVFGRSTTGGASYYADVDLLQFANAGNSKGFAIVGPAAHFGSGSAVNGAGDVNGDGIADLVVGASGAGYAFVVFGRDLTTDGAASYTNIDLAAILTAGSVLGFAIYGDGDGDQTGASAQAAGDVNADGIKDIVIGAYNARSEVNGQPRGRTGKTYVIYGRSVARGAASYTNIDLTQAEVYGYRVIGAETDDQNGVGVSSAGDFNHDGIDDIVTGSPNANGAQGAVYVIFGAVTTPSSQPSTQPSAQPTAQPSRQPSRQPTSQPSSPPSRQPSSQPSAQPSRQPSRQPTSQPSRQPSRQPTSQPTQQPSTQPSNPPNNLLDVELRTLTGLAGFTIKGASAGDQSGVAVRAAGDINNDGVGDVIVGSYTAAVGVPARSSAGISYVVFGRAASNGIAASYADIDLAVFSNAGSPLGFAIFGVGAGGLSGNAVDKAGDVNSDGIDDIVIGATYTDPGTLGGPARNNAGATFVVFGRSYLQGTSAYANIDLALFTGNNPLGYAIYGAFSNDQSGRSVAGAGDVSGDGVPDIVIGAWTASPYVNSAFRAGGGVTYVVYGRAGTTAASRTNIDLADLAVSGSAVGFAIYGAGQGDGCGSSVSAAGDVNGDGTDDVIIGALKMDPYFNNILRTDAGAAYVIYGRVYQPSVAASGSNIDLTLFYSGGFSMYGAAAHDNAGYSVAGAGDVNQDGLADVLVGAPGADIGSKYDAGKTYVIFGRSITMGSASYGDIDLNSFLVSGSARGFAVLGASINDNSGCAVSSAGDVNGDGVGDILIGAYKVDNLAGRSYVIHGRAATRGAASYTNINLTTFADRSSQGYRILSAHAGDQNGWAVGAAGDVNNDGVDDLIVGSVTAQVDGVVKKGASYVIFGAIATPSSQPSSQPSRQPSAQPSRQPSRQPSSQPSTHPSTQPTSRPSKQPLGLQLRTLTGPAGFTIKGASFNDQNGASVRAAGDVNKDGIADLIVGSSWASTSSPLRTNTGITYVVFGRAASNGLTASYADIELAVLNNAGSPLGFAIFGVGTEGFIGYSVDGAGDVNSDGIDDVVIGSAHGNPVLLGGPDRFNAGVTYVVFGRGHLAGASSYANIDLALFTGNNPLGYAIYGANAFEDSGLAVSGAGDVNGDGFKDIIIGGWYASPDPTASGSPRTHAGTSYVVYGRAGVDPASRTNIDMADFVLAGSSIGFAIYGASSGDHSGKSVSRAGDVNQDGVDDVIVGAFAASPIVNTVQRSYAGMAYVIFGRMYNAADSSTWSNIDLTSFAAGGSNVGFTIQGAVANDNLGYSVRTAGDVNHDGVADVVVGAPGVDGAVVGRGVTYVVFGRAVAQGYAASHADVDLQLISQSGSALGFAMFGAAGDFSGSAVSGAGDVNGDGVGDILIGAYKADGLTGRSYLVHGRAASGGASSYTNIDLASFAFTTSRGFRILGALQGDLSGGAVSAAGDVNHDGVDDLIVGSIYADIDGVVNKGASYVIFGAIATPSSQPSSQPSKRPSAQPSLRPTSQPSSQPSKQPTARPSSQPSAQPTVQPSDQPSRQPSVQPSSQPSSRPSSQPSHRPSTQPSSSPTSQPSARPSGLPSSHPSAQPSDAPSSQPTSMPSRQPSSRPSCQPQGIPTAQPSGQPTGLPTVQPSSHPSSQPTSRPSAVPSTQPSVQPSALPSSQPSSQPTATPTVQPTDAPSSQPSARPSSYPTTQPSVQPSGQPSVQPVSLPSGQPSAGPSSQPSSQPTAQPTGAPSNQPTGIPSTLPTTQPLSQPSAAPSVQPSARPSVQPSSGPSSQPTGFPSVRPSCVPSSQPCVAPSAQPTWSPSAQPTAGPTVQPSGAPSAKPSSQPSVVPSSQPSQQPRAAPSAQPTSAPSARPTRPPTGEWAAVVNESAPLSTAFYPYTTVWVCGGDPRSEHSHCVLTSAQTGDITAQYSFDWHSVRAVMPSSVSSELVVSAHKYGDVQASDVATCAVPQRDLHCRVKSFRDCNFQAASLVPLPNVYMYIGWYNVYTSVTIISAVSGNVRSYIYTAGNVKSFNLSQIQSPSAFVGGFVAGTAVRATATPVNYIVAGMVRTEAGIMRAMILMPSDSNVDIVNSADLVNAMALESAGPDSFIAGGLGLTDGLGKHAYLLRTNALFANIQYSVRYVSNGGSGRRALSATAVSQSVVRGMVLVDSSLFMIVDVTRDNITHLTVLKANSISGAIIQQVHVTASSSTNLTCRSVVSTVKALVIVCNTYSDANHVDSILMSVDQALTFDELPVGFVRSEELLFVAENIPFARTELSITKSTVVIPTTNSDLTVANQSPTHRPTSMPSSAPSTQPSSSPTAAPSVTARPTSTPSTSEPTNTHRPSPAPTPAPTRRPTVTVSARPTQTPSMRPSTATSAVPTCVPSAKPSRAPVQRPSARPTALLTARPSAVVSPQPTAAPTTNIAPEDDSRSSMPPYVVGVAVGGGLGMLLVGFLLFKYYENLEEEKAKEKRKVEYFRQQAILAEEARAETEKYIRKEKQRAVAAKAEKALGRAERESKKRKAANRARAWSRDSGGSFGKAAPAPPGPPISSPHTPTQRRKRFESFGSNLSYNVSSLHSSERSLFERHISNRRMSRDRERRESREEEDNNSSRSESSSGSFTGSDRWSSDGSSGGSSGSDSSGGGRSGGRSESGSSSGGNGSGGSGGGRSSEGSSDCYGSSNTSYRDDERSHVSDSSSNYTSD